MQNYSIWNTFCYYFKNIYKETIRFKEIIKINKNK